MKKKQVMRPVIQLIVALVVAFLLYDILNPNKISFENLALGTQTSAYQAKDKTGKTIHFLHMDSTELREFEDLCNYSLDSVTLILGNSQTHSINQLKKKDKNFVELINESSAKNRKNGVVAFSFPNANLQELYLALDYALSRNLRVNKLILPVFMDDLRESGVREVFFTELFERNYKMDNITAVSQEINAALAAGDKIVESANPVELTTQEKSEKWLNQFLEAELTIWGQRENMRGSMLNWLYMLRNTVFGIRPGSVRHMIAEPYNKNLDALKYMLQLAKNKGISVYLYIPPIRSDVTLPYDQSELLKFNKDVNELAMLNSAKIKDFSSIIPGKYWGYKESTNFIDSTEVDFMHFQLQGHRILADSLIQFISK
jgi:hypothetical protein